MSNLVVRVHCRKERESGAECKVFGTVWYWESEKRLFRF